MRSDSLSGRTAVVSGGAQGIGAAICHELADRGMAVVIADVDEAAGEKTAGLLSDQGFQVLFQSTDIADERSVRASIDRTADRYGSIDVLVNCAGAFIMRGVDAEVDDWRTMFDVNVLGYALMAKHAVPYLRAGGNGSIVNISSISAFIAQPGLTTYSTMKAAVTHLTRMLAQELAPQIRVNAVCPGNIYSDNNAAVLRRTMNLDRAAADQHPQVGGRAMLRRVGDPVEVARAVAFLASDDASFITAENLVVDGGHMTQ
ncbi:SDR family NAD(P)-dependent oxidoreductase [Kribbella sp. NPDC056345]|uniref:SDR family NAD(P)-dependent oxidoreductase n=1 Tax=Kribbella sp. NPDC056345 TaxID=3345789 RepID=UPI0035D85726